MNWIHRTLLGALAAVLAAPAVVLCFIGVFGGYVSPGQAMAAFLLFSMGALAGMMAVLP